MQDICGISKFLRLLLIIHLSEFASLSRADDKRDEVKRTMWFEFKRDPEKREEKKDDDKRTMWFEFKRDGDKREMKKDDDKRTMWFEFKRAKESCLDLVEESKVCFAEMAKEANILVGMVRAHDEIQARIRYRQGFNSEFRKDCDDKIMAALQCCTEGEICTNFLNGMIAEIDKVDAEMLSVTDQKFDDYFKA